MSFTEYLQSTYDAKFLISDSGSAQEEPAFFRTPVLIPRDFTERPESIEAECSFILEVDNPVDAIEKGAAWIDSNPKMDLAWMGDGTTAQQVVSLMKAF
jgi:UDP-N-acetylglucosamine 2-epimerase (non-hydrolysing)